MEECYRRSVHGRRLCVYCRAPATTRDHIVPRCLLESPYPKDLPTVDSCAQCNGSYSKDEEYFLAALAQVGFVPTLVGKIDAGGVVDRMLARNPRLDDRILTSLIPQKNGTVAFQPEEARLQRVVQKIAFGLFLDHYRPHPLPELRDFVPWPLQHAESVNPLVAMSYTERFTPRRWNVIQRDVFAFLFAKNWVWTDYGRLFCLMKLHETIWSAVLCPNSSFGRRRRERQRSTRRAASAQLYFPFFDLRRAFVYSGAINLSRLSTSA